MNIIFCYTNKNTVLWFLTQAYQQSLDVALEELAREDPSLRVSFDEELGQTVLAGMFVLG